MDHGHASLKSHKRKSKNQIDIRNLDFSKNRIEIDRVWKFQNRPLLIICIILKYSLLAVM